MPNRSRSSALRLTLTRSLLLVSCVCLWSPWSHSDVDSKPNILILYADDLRHDTLGIAGNPVVKTPNLDRLANEGVRFTHAYVTTSICGVSRASLLTGPWMAPNG